MGEVEEAGGREEQSAAVKRGNEERGSLLRMTGATAYEGATRAEGADTAAGRAEAARGVARWPSVSRYRTAALCGASTLTRARVGTAPSRFVPLPKW